MFFATGLITQITKITKPKLIKAVNDSAEIMRMYKENNIFTSNIMKELLTDTFEYSGNKANTILVKEVKTGKPFEAYVKYSYKTDSIDKDLFHETIQLLDNKDFLIGQKTYGIKKLPNGKFEMISGNMYNNRPTLEGIGFRLDQMQIERAIQLGIETIPRFSLAKAILYHTKMGFLPTTKSLIKIPESNSLNKTAEEFFEKIRGEIPLSEFIPVVIEKNGKFYIDVNKTKANAELSFVKKKIAQKQEKRIYDLESKPVDLSLSGEELETWKEIIQKYPILSKLDFIFPKYKSYIGEIKQNFKEFV